MKRVTPGQRFKITADEWNNVARHVDTDFSIQNRTFSPSKNGALIVDVLNTGEADIEGHAPVDITTLNPTGDVDFPAMVFNGTAVASTSTLNFVGIAQEPIPANTMGKVLVVGFTLAKVSIVDATHKFATISGGALTSAASGPYPLFIPGETTSGTQKTCMVKIGCSGSGAEIFWVEPSDGLSSTYSSDDRHIYGAYLHADCSGVWDDTVTSCYFWIPNHITSHEIVFPGPAPILPCIKTSLEIPVPEGAPEGTEPTVLTVYVPIDTGWVIR